MPRKRTKSPTHDIAAENFWQGEAMLTHHPLFEPLSLHAHIVRREGNACPPDGWAVVTTNGAMHVHPTRRGSPEEWAYVLAHCLLHLGFGHCVAPEDPLAWNAACDIFLAAFQRKVKLGQPPPEMQVLGEPPATTEQRIYDLLRDQGLPSGWQSCGAAGPHGRDLYVEPARAIGLYGKPVDWQALLGQGLAAAVVSAVRVAAGEIPSLGSGSSLKTPAARAREWFVNSYPLLGALAATFKLIEDSTHCHQLGITVAAVDPDRREIFMNPAATRPPNGMSEEECRFVMAHELLHVGLRHDARCQGRDPFLWNVACFPADTWDGEGKPIQELATVRRNYSGEVINLDSQGGYVSCTPEHPFFARRRLGKTYPIRLSTPSWIEVRELQVGDYLLVPYICKKTTDEVIDLRPHIREGTDALGRSTFANRAVKEIPLDEDVAWLIGLYVAEGDSSPKVRFTMSATETDIAQRAIQILQRIGYKASTHQVNNTLTINTGAEIFGRWLKANCGESARTKHIPRVILTHAVRQIRESFLAGLVAGDGHVRKQTTSNTIVAMIGSVSARLVSDVALLLAQEGIGGSARIMRRGPGQVGRTWTDKELILYCFYWNPAGIATTTRMLCGNTVSSHSQRWHVDEHGVWYLIRSKRSVPFEGTVYNRTTPDHTYIANGFLVHNCDFVINSWLLEMGVGALPRVGGLFDPELKGLSAEAIYDRIVTDMRRYRRLATLRGIGVSDILEPGRPDWWESGAGIDLDAFYRGALGQGLTYHQQEGRGLLPAGLVQEIEALAQPPIPWDVELARWFDAYFPPVELVRSYARPSRHQSATPDIPRPRWVPPPDWEDGRTFGVVLDTSGSMDRTLLAKALGAIASYSLSRDVPWARVIFCDAVPYDQGHMRPEDIAGEVRVRGRGGTVLQPAIDLLERAEDFPPDGPILIITDGRCDHLNVHHEHAYLMPAGASLPFLPRGPVFRVK
jgi:hypothetical protein